MLAILVDVPVGWLDGLSWILKPIASQEPRSRYIKRCFLDDEGEAMPALSTAGKSPQVPVLLVDRMKKKMVAGKNVQT